MKIIFLYIGGVFLLFSCSKIDFSKAESFKKSVANDVFVNFSLTDNARINDCVGVIVAFPAGYEYLGYCGINVNYQLNEKEFGIQLKKIIEKRILQYNSIDSCNVILPDFKNNTNKKYCAKQNIPIFNAYAGKVPLEKDFLSLAELEYYIFEYKEGKYLKGDDLSQMDQIDLFEDSSFSHGFSNGAIVDRSGLKITYFVTIW